MGNGSFASGSKILGTGPIALESMTSPGRLLFHTLILGSILDANTDHRFGNSKEQEEVAVEGKTKTTDQDNSEGGDATQGENAHDQSD